MAGVHTNHRAVAHHTPPQQLSARDNNLHATVFISELCRVHDVFSLDEKQ